MIRCHCPGTPYFHFSPGSGPCAFKNCRRPPSLPGNAAAFLLRSSLDGKQRDGPRSGAAQTAHFTAGVFGAPQLEALSCRHAAGTCRVVPFTPGHASVSFDVNANKNLSTAQASSCNP